jgi:hypothetical protein
MKGKREPFEGTVEYDDGSTGTIAAFADDMRDALEAIRYWLPLHRPAVKLTIILRSMDEDARTREADDTRGDG